MSIEAAAGHDASDLARYRLLLEGGSSTAATPSLQRLSTSSIDFGLYAVIPGPILSSLDQRATIRQG